MTSPLGTTKAAANAVQVEFDSSRAGSAVTLPQRIAIFGQGNDSALYTTDKLLITSSKQAGDTYGYGSPIHLVSRILFSVGGDRVAGIPVTVYPCETPVGGAQNTREITITGTATEAGTLTVQRGTNIFTIGVKNGSVAADLNPLLVDQINGDLNYPFLAAEAGGVITLTTKASGAWGNDIDFQILNIPAGLAIVNTNNDDGAGFIDVEDPLLLVGNAWETLLINCSPEADSTTFSAFEFWGEGRWDPLITLPAMVFTGSNSEDLTALRAITDARRSDRVNVLTFNAGSPSLGLEIAANQVLVHANISDQNPARSITNQFLINVSGGAEQVQPGFNERDLCVDSGLSTTEITDGKVQVKDSVTMYHPLGEEDPAYAKTASIIKLMNVIFALSARFKQPYWDGVPLVPNDQSVSSASGAKKPSDAITEAQVVVNSLARRAVLVNPEETIDNIQAQISSLNPDRIDLDMPITLSGNNTQISTNVKFAFLRGE